MDLGSVALIITIAVIVTSIVTKKCTESLYIGTIVASIFLFGKNFASGWLSVLVAEFTDNTWLWLLLGLFGSLTALFETSESTLGFSKTVNRLCKKRHSCRLAAFLLGLLIFVDDYLNVMSVGLCMKNAFDDKKIPREELAFIVDCTGTPVCILVPISSWAAFYGNLFSKYEGVPDNTYLSLIPYLFYPMIIMLFLLLFCLGILPRVGAMKTSCSVISEGKKKTEKGTFTDFIIPLVVLIAVSIVADEILLGILSAMAACFLLYIPRRKMNLSEFTKCCIKGFEKTVSIIFLLMGCYMLKNITSQMQMGQFIVKLFRPVLNVKLLAFITFVIAAFMSFSTGCVWGTSALIVPIIMPLAFACNANIPMVMAAVVSGGVFGAQACVYSDTTVMSASSCSVTNTAHAFSQMPYICTAAALSALIYLCL